MQKNPPMELMITAILHKTDKSDWTDEELSPISDIEFNDATATDSVLGAAIYLRNGENKDINGERMC